MMKVASPGVLVHVLGHTEINGWTVESDRFYPTLNSGEGRNKLTVCVLIHIGRTLGVELAEVEAHDKPLPECFDAQREALDVIAMARWREQS